jgi:hypothetical protein
MDRSVETALPSTTPRPNVSRLQTITHLDVGSSVDTDHREREAHRFASGLDWRTATHAPAERARLCPLGSATAHLTQVPRRTDAGRTRRRLSFGESLHWPRPGFSLERRSGLFPRTLASRHRPLGRAPEPRVRTCGSSRTMQDYRRNDHSGPGADPSVGSAGTHECAFRHASVG